MPRLTKVIYLERQRFLGNAWQDFPPIFSIVAASQQQALHSYYQTHVDAEDDALIAARRELSARFPSLPHQASKTFHVIYRAFRQAFEYAQGDELRFYEAVHQLAQPSAVATEDLTDVYHQPDRMISVRGLAKPQPDIHKLLRAIFMLVQEHDETDAKSDSDRAA